MQGRKPAARAYFRDEKNKISFFKKYFTDYQRFRYQKGQIRMVFLKNSNLFSSKKNQPNQDDFIERIYPFQINMQL